jgi:hypothetical protein
VIVVPATVGPARPGAEIAVFSFLMRRAGHAH